MSQKDIWGFRKHLPGYILALVWSRKIISLESQDLFFLVKGTYVKICTVYTVKSNRFQKSWQ